MLGLILKHTLFKGHPSSDKLDNPFMEFPWVTNDNSVHLCQGPASVYLELYFISMNIVSTQIISVSFITVLLNTLYKI